MPLYGHFLSPQLLENDMSEYDDTCREYSPGESLEVYCFSGLSVKAAILDFNNAIVFAKWVVLGLRILLLVSVSEDYESAVPYFEEVAIINIVCHLGWCHSRIF